MISIQREPYSDTFVKELEAILPTHWEELANNKDKVPLKPDYGKFELLDQKDILRIITCREDGKLIGYLIGTAMTGIKYTTSVDFTMDLFYIDPAHRGKWAGIKLLKQAEKILKEEGIHRMYLSSKTHQNQAERLYKILGYEHIQVTYLKYIGD